MKFFKSLLSLLSRDKQHANDSNICRHRPAALESSMLARLPSELILYVIEFLPVASSTLFTITCTKLYSLRETTLVGARLKDKVHTETLEFLLLLERDLPDYVVCHDCVKLHSIEHIVKQKFCNGVKCQENDRSLWISTWINPRFRTVLFQMVMKRYRRGADVSSLLSLLTWNYSFSRERSYNESTTALKIVNGSLLIRTHTALILPIGFDLTEEDLDAHRMLQICPHFGFARLTAPGSRWGIFKVVLWRQGMWDGMGSLEGVLYSCKFCGTDFRVDFMDLGEQGNATFFTTWKNLGQGMTPHDRQYQRHLNGLLDIFQRRQPIWEEIYLEAQSICSEFEGGELYDISSIITDECRKELSRKI